MYHPTTRLLAVLEMLQAHQQLTGEEIARRLEVDQRSVRRYILMLQDMGIPVEGTRGIGGGYSIQPGFKLPPLMFTDSEALALTLGLIVAQRQGLPVSTADIEGALAKIERVMPQTLREQVQAVQSALTMNLSRPPVTPQSQFVLTLSTAVQNNQSVLLNYRSWGEAESERILDPYGVVYHGGYWYTVGYCHLRRDLRTFRLDRIVDVELDDAHFVPPADFNPLEQVLRSIASTAAAYHIEVLLKLTMEDVRQRFTTTVGICTETPDGVLLRCDLQSLDWFARFLINLNCEFVIDEPDALYDALLNVAESVVQQVSLSKALRPVETR